MKSISQMGIALAILAVGFGAGCQKTPSVPSRSPAEVAFVVVQPKTVPVEAPFVAQAKSSHQVEVMARVNGFLEKILYHEGDMVREGQVMFQMDRKPFQAQVDAARAEVEVRRAQLWTARANLDRIKPLADQDAASKSDLDNAIGSVQAAEAALHEAGARLQKADLDLGYTTIKAPVSGMSSQSLMREGAYLSSAGPSATLTYVAKLDPIWIEFSVSQNEMATTRQEVAQGTIRLPKHLNYVVEVELTDGVRYPHKGKLSFADPSFNQQTGTFLVRAELPNPKGVIRPGMFVKAYIKGAFRPNAIVVPQKAVQQTPNGHMVFVVDDKGTAEVRPVVVGEWIGEDWVVSRGLKAGDRVIVDGFQKLGPGVPVKALTPQANGTATQSSASAGSAAK